MEQKLLELFPDENVTVKDYKSFVNMPERIQISSQQDMNDYDQDTLTNYYNFRVRLPRPALNVKSLQLARASLPLPVTSIPDSECTWWYYALPQESPGTIYDDDPNNPGQPGIPVFTFDTAGILKTTANVVIRAGEIYLNNNGVPGNLEYTFDLNGIVSFNGNPVAGASINFSTGLVTIPPQAPVTQIESTYDTSLEYIQPPNFIPCKKGEDIIYFIKFDINGVFFDSGILVVNGVVSSFDRNQASAGNVQVPVYTNNIIDYFIEYTNPQLAQIRSNYLRYVRLVPSNAQPELMGNFAGGFNRIFVDYDDLIAELNNSTVDDPLNGEGSNGDVGTFKFVPNQIAFSVSERFSKIVFTGLDQTYTYVPAASDDPLWVVAAQELQERDRQNTQFTYTGITQIVQPYIPYRDLNLRLGFTYVTYFSGLNFQSMIRPVPPSIAPVPPLLSSFSAYDHVAPGYGDLVYSSCCHIYCTLTGGSTIDSIAEKALAASIPLNSPTLGIGFHSLPLSNPLTKISSQITEIDIELRTDTGQPFYIGNNAIVSLEFILTY